MLLLLAVLSIIGGLRAFEISDGYQDVINGYIYDNSYLYITPNDWEDNNTDIPPSRSEPLQTDEDHLLEAKDDHFDTLEYNELTKSTFNITRRDLDPDKFTVASSEWWFITYQYDMFKHHGKNPEYFKRNALIDIGIQFLVHTRYKVRQALKQREFLRDDKRYKLGYLFNRLRRLHTEHNLMYGSTIEQQGSKASAHLKILLRAYQHVVRIAVDIRDIQTLIKEVYNQPAPYDFVTKVTTTPSP